jgi:hypothetical protein
LDRQMKAGGKKIIRIGGASGFWGDSSLAVPQFLEAGAIDYLVFDYLAEVTMSILAGARLKKPNLGYATDFVELVQEHAAAIASSGVRLIANAGGVNPRACAEALKAATAGLPLRIAFVEGDDVMPLIPALREERVGEIQDGRPLPEELLTANAYLGALPIKVALDMGAHIVVTGRCVDSAVTLGALMHEFEWSAEDFDRLAQASLAGHVIECGCQGTGGLYTDWREVPNWENMGFPILECTADGGIVVTKPAGTGGLVTPATVGEQILYEVADPTRYLLPDVTCDFSDVHLMQDGPDRVRISGVRGSAPTDTYKVSATYLGGFKAVTQLTIVGFEAVQKAQRVGPAILARTRAIFKTRGLEDYTDTLIEVLGGESAYGPHGAANASREVVLRIAVRHNDKSALEIFAREIAPAGTAFSPGITGVVGRAKPTPAIQQYAFLLRKERLAPRVVSNDVEAVVAIPSGGRTSEARARPVTLSSHILSESDEIQVPLIAVARARSGDKGNISNIGVIARSVDLLPVLYRELTEARVKSYLSHAVLGRVKRFDVPGLNAVNFVCVEALGGGGMASLRNDPYGKGMAQILLSMPVSVPRRLLPQSDGSCQ